MEAPNLPENENLRLRTLRMLNVLDTNPDKRFDGVTRLACHIFQTPIALISLVEHSRQWFKSCQGLQGTETPRYISFCGHTILQSEPLVVTDALLDHRFDDNPLVLGEPNIRFYAGFPLIMPNQTHLGTLCVIDRKPRPFTETEAQLLTDLGRLVQQDLVTLYLTMVDDLTLLLNRRGIQSLGNQTLKLCKESGYPCFLIFLDLTRFKLINDRYGHAEGDYALTQFSRILGDSFRDIDVVGRLGGDEFVVLLANASLEDWEKIQTRLNQNVAYYNQTSHRGYDLSYNFGVVAYDPLQHASLDDLLAQGDRLMYLHKQSQIWPKTGPQFCQPLCPLKVGAEKDEDARKDCEAR